MISFWRHPFTAEDPLLSKWCNAKFLQICWDEEKASSKYISRKYSFLDELFPKMYVKYNDIHAF